MYIRQVSRLLRFADSGNGDIYAFDMSAEEAEKPVVYWEHETGDIKYLADSFRDYLERIARLYFVGDEIWQMELFLESDGINPDNEYAVRWRAWFDALSGPESQAVNEDLKSLFALVLTRRKLSDKIKKALLAYRKEDIFSMIQKNLLNTKNRDTKELLVTMIAELIGGTAKDWVESLWEKIEKHCADSPSVFIFEQYEIPSDLAAYLSAGCMEEEKAFQLVIRFLTQRAGNKIDGLALLAEGEELTAPSGLQTGRSLQRGLGSWRKQSCLISEKGSFTISLSRLTCCMKHRFDFGALRRQGRKS